MKLSYIKGSHFFTLGSQTLCWECPPTPSQVQAYRLRLVFFCRAWRPAESYADADIGCLCLLENQSGFWYSWMWGPGRPGAGASLVHVTPLFTFR